MEDLRLMTNLGTSAAAAYQTYINERKQTERALRDSEEQYRLVVETATDAVISINESSQIVFVNSATERSFGYASSELIGQPLMMLMPERMRAPHQAGIQRYVVTGQRHINWDGTELLARRKDGEEFPIEVAFGEIVRNGQHRFTGCIRDISERKHAEAIRAARASQALVRADVNLAFGKRDDLTAILQACAESVVRHLDPAFARIWTLDNDHEVLELRASAGVYTHLDGAHARVPVGQLEIGLIAAERKRLLTNEVLNDPRISDKTWARSQGMVALAGQPLIVGHRVVGVIAMFSRSSLTAHTIDTLASVADAIAQGIERKRAEDALHSTRAELARVARLTM